jgi:hypothetical protein
VKRRAVMIAVVFIFVGVTFAGSSPSSASDVSDEAYIQQAMIYLGQIAVLVQVMTAGLEIAESSASPSTELGRANLAATFTVYQAVQVAFDKLRTPEGFEELHALLASSIGAYADMADECKAGIVALRLSTLERCAEAYRVSRAYLEEFRVLLQALRDEVQGVATS